MSTKSSRAETRNIKNFLLKKLHIEREKTWLIKGNLKFWYLILFLS